MRSEEVSQKRPSFLVFMSHLGKDALYHSNTASFQHIIVYIFIHFLKLFSASKEYFVLLLFSSRQDFEHCEVDFQKCPFEWRCYGKAGCEGGRRSTKEDIAFA
jgi:hypothetical protein